MFKLADHEKGNDRSRPRIASPAGVCAAVALVLLALAVFVAQLSSEREAALASWRSNLGAVTGDRKQAVQRWLAERRADAQVLSWAPELVGLCMEKACPRGIDLAGSQTQLDNLTVYSGYLGAYLFSPAGDTILYPEKAGPPCVGVSQRAVDVVGARTALMDDIRSGSECGGLMLGFLAPVFRRASLAETPSQSAVVGVVGLYVHPEKSLFPILTQPVLLSGDVQVYLVRKEEEGLRILTPTRMGADNRWLAFSPKEPRHSVELAAVLGQERTGLFTDYDGRDVVGAVRWIPEAGWGIVATVDKASALQEWRKGSFKEAAVAGLGLLCLALAVVGAWRGWSARRYRELLETLERRARSLAALHLLSQGFDSAHDSNSVVLATIEGTYEASGADWVIVFVGEGPRLRIAGARNLPGTHEKVLSEMDPDQGVVGRVYRTGQCEFVANYGEDPDALTALVQQEEAFSVAGIPLLVDGHVMGVLVAARRERRDFPEDERGLLEALGNMAGVALSRARAAEGLVEEAEVRRRAEGRLRALHESTASLTGEHLFRQVAKVLSEELGAGWVEVSRVANGLATPIVMYQGGSLLVRPPFHLEGTPCGYVADTGQLVHCGERAWEVYPGARFLQKHKIESFVGAPLINSQGRILGVLCALANSPHAMGSGETDLLELYARRVAGEVERIEIERELLEARRALETLIHNIPGAVYRCSAAVLRQVVFISPGCRSVTGHGVEDLTGKNASAINDLIVTEDRARVGRSLEEALNACAPFEIEYRIHDRKGDLRWIYDVGCVVETETGERFIEGVLLDQTERRVLEAQLTHSQRMEALGRLAGGVAHDFNNLLTAISGYAEILARRFPEGDRSLRPVREILRAADRAAELTRQLLAFSRRQAVEPKILDFNDAVDGVLRMMGRLLGEDVSLNLDLGADVGSVRADPGQLEQVVLNLCVNARDALPGGGTLSVRTRVAVLGESERRYLPAGAYAVLEVSDTGVGMAPHIIEHVFEPFFTTKDPGKGTGLGLATVYGVVKQAGGDVVVESELGKGTTFQIYWPKQDGHAVAALVDSPAAGAPGKGETVLLVEDDESVRRLSAEHLQDMGYRVVAAPAAPEALAILSKSGKVDVMVTDVVMPGMSGLELARQVRSLWPSVPVIFVSGHTGDAVFDHGIQEEGAAFLQKPFRLDDLARAVGAALGR